MTQHNTPKELYKLKKENGLLLEAISNNYKLIKRLNNEVNSLRDLVEKLLSKM